MESRVYYKQKNDMALAEMATFIYGIRCGGPE
jgi:hypothetical protein